MELTDVSHSRIDVLRTPSLLSRDMTNREVVLATTQRFEKTNLHIPSARVGVQIMFVEVS